MGYIRHHTIVCTAWSPEDIAAAYVEALVIFDDTRACVSQITPEGMNGQRSFFVAPDGSKEGWEESAKGDAARARFIKWLRSAKGYVDFVEVEFGGDGEKAVITDDVRATPSLALPASAIEGGTEP